MNLVVNVEMKSGEFMLDHHETHNEANLVIDVLHNMIYPILE